MSQIPPWNAPQSGQVPPNNPPQGQPWPGQQAVHPQGYAAYGGVPNAPGPWVAPQAPAKPPMSSSWPSFALLFAGILGLVSIFLPIVTVPGLGSLSWLDVADYNRQYSNDNSAFVEWIIVLVAGILVILVALASAIARVRGLRITTGIVGILAGAFMAFEGFRTIADFSSAMGPAYGASLGAALWILGVAGILVILLAVLVLAIRPKMPAYR